MSDLTDSIDKIEAALLARYNVQELPPALAVLVDEARAGRIGGLQWDLDNRELYRWRNDVDAALMEIEIASGTAPTDIEISRMSKSELIAMMEARGIAVPARANMGDLRALLLGDPEPEAETEPAQPEQPASSFSEADPSAGGFLVNEGTPGDE